MPQVVTIGVAGGSASGKSTIAQAIVERVGSENIAHLLHDSYYKPLEMFSQTEHNRPPFSKVLRHLRLRAGLTQTELGERAGLSHRTISDLERGTRRKTYSSTVKLLAKALELSSEEASRLDASVDRSRGTTPSTPAHHDRRRTNTL